jgi:hypothetical protein
MTAARKKKRRKPKYIRMRFRKGDYAHNLQAAVQHYVHANGGALVIVGDIETQQWGEGPGHFRVAVRCLGRMPEKKVGER